MSYVRPEVLAQLTLREKNELWSAIDGPITEQDVADKIAQRGAVKPEPSAKDRKVLTQHCQQQLAKHRNEYAAAVAMVDRYRSAGNDRKADMWSREAEDLRREVEFYEDCLRGDELMLAAE